MVKNICKIIFFIVVSVFFLFVTLSMEETSSGSDKIQIANIFSLETWEYDLSGKNITGDNILEKLDCIIDKVTPKLHNGIKH